MEQLNEFQVMLTIIYKKICDLEDQNKNQVRNRSFEKYFIELRDLAHKEMANHP